jgi:hypothetical protein
MSATKGATAQQWKTLGSLSKHLGVRSATVLVATALGRTETDVRSNGVTRRQATQTINAAIALQASREQETRPA